MQGAAPAEDQPGGSNRVCPLDRHRIEPAGAAGLDVLIFFDPTCLNPRCWASGQAAGLGACSDQALAFAISSGTQSASIKQRVSEQLAESRRVQDQQQAASENAALAGSLLLSLAGMQPLAKHACVPASLGTSRETNCSV
jgi:hypothetical protein